jgi:hypothetical protein
MEGATAVETTTTAAMKTAAGVAPATAVTAAMGLCVGRLQRHGQEPSRRQDRNAARDLRNR